MQENMKYPIKYAILEIMEPIWGHSPNYKTVAYVVSKAYVVGEHIKYLADGTRKQSYDVVFLLKIKKG